ncbi:MAG: hypothetical protein IJI13_08110, partial [Oscillospiraceae bacterium]|nr:hypothetical protein [Oscillospiraceae bacterium]
SIAAVICHPASGCYGFCVAADPFPFLDGFVMGEKFAARVDDYFAFRDQRNCERVYDAISTLYPPALFPSIDTGIISMFWKTVNSPLAKPCVL